MKILFTKKTSQTMIFEKLGDRFSCEFVEVIKINPVQIEAFDLQNKSLIFTSKNAVNCFFNNNFHPNEKVNKIYAVGFNTKKELENHGCAVFKMAKNAKELSEYIINQHPEESYLHFCGNLVLNELHFGLSENLISYKKITVYETELLFPEISENYNAVCFFSPSGVRSFAKFNSFDSFILFSIGETTANELKNFTKNKIFTSKKNTLEDLLKTINQQL